MKIEIIDTKRFGYSVEVDGEIILECLGQEEVDTLTIGQIKEFMEEIDG